MGHGLAASADLCADDAYVGIVSIKLSFTYLLMSGNRATLPVIQNE